MADAGKVHRVGIAQTIEASFRYSHVEPSSVLVIARFFHQAACCQFFDEAGHPAFREVSEFGEFRQPNVLRF